MVLEDIEIKQDIDSDNTDHTPLKKVDTIEVKKADEYATSESFMALANIQKIKKSLSKKSESKLATPVLIKYSSPSRRSGSTSLVSRHKKKEPTPSLENKDVKTREKKLDYIRKLERLCHLNKRQMKVDPINYTLDEIENEFKKESNEYKNKQGAELYKGLLKMTTTGFEMANTHLNPYSDTIDLVGWSDSVKNDIDSEQYDEVLYQLYDKYGATVEWGPEWKLGFMLTQSAVIYATTRHISQNPNMIQGMLNKFMGIPTQSSVPKYSSKFSNQDKHATPQQPKMTSPIKKTQNISESDTSDDLLPSRIKEMEPPNYAEILEKMKQQEILSKNDGQLLINSETPPPRKPGRPRKQPQLESDIVSDVVVGQINVPVRRKGRPRKVQVTM